MNWRAILLTFSLIFLTAFLFVDRPALVLPVHAGPLPDTGPFSEQKGGAEQVVRVTFDDLRTAYRVAAAIEPLEAAYDRGYLLLAASPEEMARLRASGLMVTVDEDWIEGRPFPYSVLGLAGAEAIPGYDCYRTVEETYATAETLAAAFPNLATWNDVGDSWEKTQDQGGYDMRVLVLTNTAVPGPKPKIFITASIHAREYTPAELVTRFAEQLLNSYGNDADITWILDYHEIHLMLMANPDGRKWAELGYWWRKNTNEAYCSAGRQSQGADLNRNFPFHWGCCGGSSVDECSEVFRGAGPASEPETQAIVEYMRASFPDSRGPGPADAAPIATPGLYLDMHSSGQLLLWPWGDTAEPAPNADQLQTLGRKLAYFNGHWPTQSIGLYPTDGTTTDFAYGELGIAAYTYELGTSFFEPCTYFENTLLPANIPSLLYALKVAREPYRTPAGPDILDIAAGSSAEAPGVPAGTVIEVSAVVDDRRYSPENGMEPRQAIAGARYKIDLPFWQGGETGAMRAVDGVFDDPREAVTAEIDTTGLSAGRHTLFLSGQDAAGNWGAVSAIFFYLNEGEPLPRLYYSYLSFLSDGRSGTP